MAHIQLSEKQLPAMILPLLDAKVDRSRYRPSMFPPVRVVPAIKIELLVAA